MDTTDQQPGTLREPTFTVSEPLCTAYCELFAHDFSTAAVKKWISHGASIEPDRFEEKLNSFHNGLSRNRLELSGRRDDVGGWLLCYIDAYVDPEDVSHVFKCWPTLADADVKAVIEDASRLSPILSKAWDTAAKAVPDA